MKNILAATLFMTVALQAQIGPPVQVSITTTTTPRTGQASTIQVQLESGADLPQVEYRIEQPDSWQIISGPQLWTGPMSKGQKLDFTLTAIPLRDDPGALTASAQIPGFEPFAVALHQVEPALAAPKSTAANRSAVVNVIATGRFIYLNENGLAQGVRSATVELWNDNGRNPDQLCGSSTTDEIGTFKFEAPCGTSLDNPDVFVRIVLNNSIADVKPSGGNSYSFRSPVISNSTGGTVSFGTITITANQPAFHAYNMIAAAHHYMKTTVDTTVSKVIVLWPVSGTFYQPAFNSISVEETLPFKDEGEIFRQYGHHILSTLAGSALTDIARCADGLLPAQCLTRPAQDPTTAWAIAFPAYFGAFQHAQWAKFYDLGSTALQFETRPSPYLFPGQEDRAPVMIAAILWDITDRASDDQDTQGVGRRDGLFLEFPFLWRVMRQYDPSASTDFNHPTDIHQLWDGFRELFPEWINHISEVYREHNIRKPQPDLRVTTLKDAPTSVTKGDTFRYIYSFGNDGDEMAARASIVQVHLQSVLTGELFLLQSQDVFARFAAGNVAGGFVDVPIPLTLPIGAYKIRACIDTTQLIPESNESNNCAQTAQFSVRNPI